MPASTAELKGQAACYIRPAGGRILVIPTDTPDEINVGGVSLAVPGQAKSIYPTEGEVIECGPDVPLVVKMGPDGFPMKDALGQEIMEPVYKPGDRVVYTKYTGHLLEFGDGAKFLLVPWEDIAGVLDPDCPALGKNQKPSFMPR